MTERPGVTIVPIHGKSPQIHDSAFVAPGCRIVGDVTIGAGSNVQDGAVLHADPGYPTIIGSGSTSFCDSLTRSTASRIRNR